MATANTVSGVAAGADAVSVTVNGLGEPAGNAPLEEVAMALRHTLGRDSGIETSRLGALCRLVANRARRSIHRAKPIVGADVYRHESGLHTAPLLKDPTAYQPFPAQETGRTPEAFVIGKHSGAAGVKVLLADSGIAVPASLCPEILPEILKEVRRRARERKASVSPQELAAIARELVERERSVPACLIRARSRIDGRHPRIEQTPDFAPDAERQQRFAGATSRIHAASPSRRVLGTSAPSRFLK